MTREGRQAREAAHQAGVAWCASERLVRRALEACDAEDDYGRYLFLQGIANILTAEGRRIAGIDQRGPVRP